MLMGVVLKKTGIVFGTALLLACSPALAEKSSEFFKNYPNYEEAGQKFLDGIEPQTGSVDLPDGVHLDLKGKFYFLNKEDSKSVLVDAWNNPPDSSTDTVGMLFPVEYDPLASGGWGIELRVEKIGYVNDEDAASIDYDDMLRDMQQDTLDGNEARVKQGYEPIKLIGWASPPIYDFTNKRLHWAKELEFGDNKDHTLNYDVRFLGREGVFVMSYIAGMQQLPEIKQSLDEVLNLASFNAGKRYSDFVPGVDSVAAVGVGGLIAGKLAAKAGLFAIALVALKKFGIFLLVPFAWAWRAIRGKSAES
jgi:uncharacterized membrane-anchored protein